MHTLALCTQQAYVLTLLMLCPVRQVQRACALPRSQGVVLVGEVGTGLVELAQAIHAGGLPPQVWIRGMLSLPGHMNCFSLIS
jgi:hypothetical protein